MPKQAKLNENAKILEKTVRNRSGTPEAEIVRLARVLQYFFEKSRPHARRGAQKK